MRMGVRPAAAVEAVGPALRRVWTDDGPIDVRVRRSRRARRVLLRVGPSCPPELVVPLGVDLGTADAVLGGHAGWLGRQVARLSVVAPDALGLERPGIIVLGGVDVSMARLTRFEPLAAMYRAEALRRLHAAVERHAETLDVFVGRISVRDPRSRWGSCSARGDLSFSWRLALTPPGVLDSVAAHEVCHRRQLNHSPAFWALLDRTAPRHREHRAWLNRHAAELNRYDPERHARATAPAAAAAAASASAAGPRPQPQLQLFNGGVREV